MSTLSQPQFSTAILLGAQTYEKIPGFKIGKVFENSSEAFKNYLSDTKNGLGIKQEKILDLFGRPMEAGTQLAAIRTHLQEMMSEARQFERKNVFVHYVGHGVPNMRSRLQELALAIEDTEEVFPFGTSLKVSDLAAVLREYARHARRFVILDCCFAGDAAIPFAPQSAMASLVEKKLDSAFSSNDEAVDELDDPSKGCGILAASDASTAAIAKADEKYTRFSGALIKVLLDGHKRLPPLLTLREIGDLAWYALRKLPENPRPFVIGPDAPEGDITANARLFPNTAFGENVQVDSCAPLLTTDCLRIVHLSDLHFGASCAAEAWTILTEYIPTLCPALILITGDIVDSAIENNLSFAKQELEKLKEKLKIPYRVCPGDTDRYKPRRKPGTEAEKDALSPSAHNRSSKGKSFDKIFEHEIIRESEEMVLAKGENRWKVALLGIDTSAERAASKQGCVLESELTAIHDAAGKVSKDADLCIALQHHQLLPIAELQVGDIEPRVREPHPKSANGAHGKSSTAPHPMMLNVGLLLEELAEGKVDLLLHGHEHRPFAARFTTVKHQQHEVTILAAGSATGASEREPSKVTDGSFNVIELREDGTVWLERHKCNNGLWKPEEETACQMFSRRDLRRILLKRANLSDDIAARRIVKRVELTPTRDIRVREVRTQYLVRECSFKHEIFNSTGIPTCNGVTIEWDDGISEHKVPKYEKDNDVDHLWYFAIAFPASRKNRIAAKIVVDTLWEMGGLLTTDDKKLYPLNYALGPERRAGKEYVAARVDEPLEELTIILRLPSKVAPEVEELEVIADQYPEWRDKPARTSPTSPATRLSPVELGTGGYVLTVPFPFPKMIYGLSWGLPSPVRDDTVAKRFAAVSRDFGKELLNAFKEGLSPELSKWSSVSLYIPHGNVWELKDFILSGSVGNAPRATAAVTNERSIYRVCWWGRTSLSFKSTSESNDTEMETAAEADMDADETALIAVPIRPPGAEEIFEPVGMVRVAYRVPPKLICEDDLQILISESAVLLLNRFIVLREQVSC